MKLKGDNMKTLNITIEPPITEHCRKCDFEEAYSFGSMRCQCPKCGESSMSRGARPKEQKPIRVMESQGSYDIAHPSDVQWNYTFYNLPEEKRCSFTVNDELENDDPIDMLIELKEIYSKYIYTGQLQKVTALVDLLDNDEERDVQENLRATAKREELERELYKLYQQNDF